ncbi:MAG: SH3 domain-containing protein [Oscillospiraceae bacterium]|nr:SH3 domain-containing protein [Oscillospiraceae bacterium]
MNRLFRKIAFIIIASILVFAFVQTAAASNAAENFVTTAGVNVRESASTNATVLRTVSAGHAVTVVTHDPAGWSRVRVNGVEGFISSEFLTISAASVTFRTTAGVNLRASASTGADVVRTINVGTNVEVLTHNPCPNDGWSRVRLEGSEGFVSSEFLQFVGNGGSQPAAASAAPQAAQSTQTLLTVSTVRLRTGPTTDADIIRVLNPNTSVEVTRAGSSGWSAVRVNGTQGYIRSDLLSEAGAVGASVGSRGVELLTMAQVRPLLRTNVDVPLTDVRTGRQFNIRIFSMGGHADVETSTRADTDIKFSIRGGRWSWAARPVWVHLGDRTIAASINGMPHDVDFIAGNGMNGHLCLHFHNTVANNQRYQADLRSAVMEAYNAGRR